jgi:hypothetical protein
MDSRPSWEESFNIPTKLLKQVLKARCRPEKVVFVM